MTRYSTIPRTLVFITHGDNILLLKGAPTRRLYPNLYNGVGGHVERGEGVLEAARREVCEETGLDLANLHLRAVLHVDEPGKEQGVLVFVFIGESLARAVVQSDEGELVWVSRGDILASLNAGLTSLPLVPDLRELLPRLLELPRDAPPIFARSTEYPDGRMTIDFEDKE